MAKLTIANARALRRSVGGPVSGERTGQIWNLADGDGGP